VLALLALPALADPTHEAIAGAQWATVTTKSHADAGTVEIWRATVDGIECFKGTAVTDAPIAKLLDVVADVASATKWSSAGVTEAKLLSKSGSTIEYYQYLDVPGWTMASDRFWFLRSTIENTPTKAVLKWTRLPEGGPHAAAFAEVKAAHPDAVEPTVNVGGWYFEQQADGVHISYEICTQPGGSIPAAIQNAATKGTLPDTVGDVVREAKKR
jgi:hypothetical protein